jgi:hypothetical protein
MWMKLTPLQSIRCGDQANPTLPWYTYLVVKHGSLWQLSKKKYRDSNLQNCVQPGLEAQKR